MGKRIVMNPAYIDLLEEIRQDPSLMQQYKEAEVGSDFHLQQEREKLLKALFSNQKSEDYELVKFLFKQELKLRKREPWKFRTYKLDYLYLSAFLLAQYREVGDLWRFVELKSLDQETDGDFDTEFLLILGTEKVYNLMSKTDNPLQFKAAHLIGKKPEDAPFSQLELEEWESRKRAYFHRQVFDLG